MPDYKVVHDFNWFSLPCSPGSSTILETSVRARAKEKIWGYPLICRLSCSTMQRAWSILETVQYSPYEDKAVAQELVTSELDVRFPLFVRVLLLYWTHGLNELLEKPLVMLAWWERELRSKIWAFFKTSTPTVIVTALVLVGAVEMVVSLAGAALERAAKTNQVLDGIA
jgi:hypothetical protein